MRLRRVEVGFGAAMVMHVEVETKPMVRRWVPRDSESWAFFFFLFSLLFSVLIVE